MMSSLRQKWGQKGVTLIELIITLAILAILASIIMPLSHMTVKRQKELELKRTLRVIRRAIDKYKEASDEGRITKDAGGSGYPPDLATLVEGISDAKGDKFAAKLRFLRRIPRDPMESDKFMDPDDTWGKRSYESDADSPSEGDDVFDVYSLSYETAIDGTQYSDW